jgi:hypothetical protein
MRNMLFTRPVLILQPVQEILQTSQWAPSTNCGPSASPSEDGPPAVKGREYVWIPVPHSGPNEKNPGRPNVHEVGRYLMLRGSYNRGASFFNMKNNLIMPPHSKIIRND